MTAKPTRTPAGDARFFIALENGHTVAAACEAAEYTRSCAYAWRRDDAAFAAQWERSRAIACELLEEEADRRGREGYDEAVFYRGEQKSSRRKYSDGLLLARLKALKPSSYRETAPVVDTSPKKINVVIRDYRAEDALKKLIAENRLSPDELDERLRQRFTRPTSDSE